jgi:membrane peptidoglycan carboxypeptidase
MKGPSIYDPLKSPAVARQRRNDVLGVWKRKELITEADFLIATRDPLQ